MNPLDKIEFEDFNDRLKEEMPIHTSTSAQVPHSFVLNFPKDLMKYSSEVDNKFLNKYQHIIEEIIYRDPNNPTANDILKYQTDYFGRYGILKGDIVFKKILTSKHRGLGGHGNPFLSFGSGGGGGLNGPEIIIGLGDAGTETVFHSRINASLSTAGIIGHKYDEIAFDMVSGGNHLKYGVYDDNATLPHNILGQTGDFVNPNDFNYRTVTEFTLTTTNVWMAIIANLGNDQVRDGSVSVTREFQDGVTYSTAFLNDPTTNNSAWNAHSKINHT